MYLLSASMLYGKLLAKSCIILTEKLICTKSKLIFCLLENAACCKDSFSAKLCENFALVSLRPLCKFI